jgi:hypothetical protein
MPQITRKLAGCQGKNCPAVWETDDPAYLAVQGTVTGAPSVPGGESVVLVPASLLRDWASGQR